MGVSGGAAFTDDCGQCVGGTSGLVENYLMDDCGECGGEGIDIDQDGICDDEDECSDNNGSWINFEDLNQDGVWSDGESYHCVDGIEREISVSGQDPEASWLNLGNNSGFGEIVPINAFGKLIMIFEGMTGGIIMSIFIVAVYRQLMDR